MHYLEGYAFIPFMEKACDSAKTIAGGPTSLARSLKVLGATITSQAVSQWKVVPADKVLLVEKLTGISRHELRPDVFGRVAA